VKVAIDLAASQAALLRQQAARLGVPVEELARPAVVDLLTTRAECFRGAAEHVVRESAELYKRLA
jgi:hypothetical protein